MEQRLAWGKSIVDTIPDDAELEAKSYSFFLTSKQYANQFKNLKDFLGENEAKFLFACLDYFMSQQDNETLNELKSSLARRRFPDKIIAQNFYNSLYRVLNEVFVEQGNILNFPGENRLFLKFAALKKMGDKMSADSLNQDRITKFLEFLNLKVVQKSAD